MPFLLSAAAILISVLMVIADAKSPIIIVPGLLSTNIFMVKPRGGLLSRWKELPVGPDGCPTRSAVENLMLKYLPATQVFESKAEVDIKVPITGDTCNVEYRTFHPTCTAENPGHPTNSDDDYFHTFVEHYVTRGYVRGRTIRSAPYDWRLSPAQLTHYYIELQKMIQAMYYGSVKDDVFKKVTLVAHSSGAPVVLYFLNNVVNHGFKDKYINAFVAISGAWSGGAAILQSLISGIQQPRTELEPLTTNTCQPSREQYTQYKDAARTFPGLAYLLPNPILWGKDRNIISTPGDKFTAYNYRDIFFVMGYLQGPVMYELVAPINGHFPAPSVPLYSFFGTGIPTPLNYIYDNSFPYSAPRLYHDDSGDGTINSLITNLCFKWAKESPGTPVGPARCIPITKESHISIIKNAGVLRTIDGVVMRT